MSFSYAQAAKGLSSTATPATAISKQSSESTTPSKDDTTAPAAAQATAPVASVPSWADDAEAEDPRHPTESTSHEQQTAKVQALPKESSVQDAPTSSIALPDLDGKDDDTSSTQNASTESNSTWENKSQASTTVEKSAEPTEKSPEKGRGKKADRAEKVEVKPLIDAPMPAVNPWTRRADELKAKAAHKNTAPKSTPKASSPVVANGAAQSPTSPAKKGKSADATESKEKVHNAESRPRARDDERAASRRDIRLEADYDKSKKGTRSRPVEKEGTSGATVLPLLPHRDEESWPTPESAVDEDRKKSQGKAEKSDSQAKEASSNRSQKKEWVPVPHTPNVIFSTPLPGAASSRRGGRGGGRGGAQGGGRSNGFAPNGGTDKDASAQSALTNGDGPRRGRAETSTARESSPQEKRNGSSGPTANEVKSSANAGEKASTTNSGPETEGVRRSPTTESASGPQLPGQNNTSRQYAQSRPNRGRRGDFGSQGEKRKDGEGISPTKDIASHDRRTSTATPIDGPDEGDRRAHPSQDGHSGHNGGHSRQSNERRQFSSFSGRERGRGGGRGSRGGYQNGQHPQFTNGHVPSAQNPTTFPLRSPTTFHPEQHAFFPSAAPQARGYRNGHRSQSVNTDSMYARGPGGYAGGSQQVPPIQTFLPFEYPMISPMSPMPYSPYGVVDPTTLYLQVSNQLEYYFSLDNLCKDLYLRKHMDSKGFVYLNFIAEFKKLKSLTADVGLIKYACLQSPNIEYRVGLDGIDRLRRADGWDKFVLGMSDRDPSAQNEGPEVLHMPPPPYQNAFDHNGHFAAGSPPPQAPVNGVHAPVVQDSPSADSDNAPVDQATNGVNGFAPTNGHIETPSAVSGEPDSFSDAQVESLTVIVRKRVPTLPLPPSVSRTFSNGSIDSKSGVPDEPEGTNGWQSAFKVNGTSSGHCFESKSQDGPSATLSLSAPTSAPALTPGKNLQYYWVKGKTTPVASLPSACTHESYTHLRYKALEQRKHALHGSCPHDMDVWYQFNSHFLIRNFNKTMYLEFKRFALEDSAHRGSDIGIKNLMLYYGESLLSTQTLIRECVARHYVELARSDNPKFRPAFQQLRAAYRNGSLAPENRKRIDDLLDDDLRASLE